MTILRRAILALGILVLLLAAPPAGAHVSDAHATDLVAGSAVTQVIEFRMGVHANGTFGLIGDTKSARDAGVRFAGANATFEVLAGPADEFGWNGSKLANTGDLFIEFRDYNAVNETLFVRATIVGLDTSSAWVDGNLTYWLSAFKHPGGERHGDGNATFHLFGDPAKAPAKPRSGLPAPDALACAAAALAATAFLRRR